MRGIRVTLLRIDSEKYKNIHVAVRQKHLYLQEMNMENLFFWVSISALALIVVIYFLTKESRLRAHEEVKAKKLPWTRIPQTNLSIGIALVLVGIIIDPGNRIVNYIIIGVGVAISVYEMIKSKSNKDSTSDT